MDKKALNHCEIAIMALLAVRKECYVVYGAQVNIEKIRDLIFTALDELNKVARSEEISDEDR